MGYQVYRATGGTRYVLHTDVDLTLHLRSVGGSNLATLGVGSLWTCVRDTKVTGSETGAQVYAVVDTTNSNDGDMWLSDNGTTFTKTATWQPGWVKDASFAGGGSLVWIIKAVPASNVPARLYERNGTGHDKTGNFWSLTSGGQGIVGMGLVY